MQRICRVDCHVYGESHLADFDEDVARNRQQARRNFNQSFRGFRHIKAARGLTFLEEYDKDTFKKLNRKTDYREKQVKEFKASFISSSCKGVFLEVGSNDYKAIVTEDEALVGTIPGADKQWELKVRTSQKIFFSPKEHRNLLTKKSERFIKKNVHRFLKFFVDLAKVSNFQVVFLSSLLERIYPGEQARLLDMMFCYVKHYMFKAFQGFNREVINNRRGEKIKFVFINVSDQFYDSPNPLNLARRDEIPHNKLVHRNLPAMKRLIEKYVSEIKKHL